MATIKFYLREGLLPRGTRTARNQADYGEQHLARLRLIQILTVIGRLGLASVREVLSAIDDRGLTLTGLCTVVNAALFPSTDPASDQDAESTPERLDARRRVDAYLASLGWTVAPEAPARATLTQVLGALRQLDEDFDIDFFRPHAEAAQRLAAHELTQLTPDGTPETVAMEWTAKVVLFEVALAALRALAAEHQVALRAGGETGTANRP